jgi:amino acid transporter
VSNANEKSKLHLAMGFRDVVLFFITACVNLQWMADSAGGGPSAIFIWLLAFLTLTVPLCLCVIELSSRYPQEGGIYIWSKEAFGDFGGYMTGWTYWLSNLPYFPAVLYFAAGNIIFAGGQRWLHLSDSATFFVTASLLVLALTTIMNVVGMEFGKWLNNAGAVARWMAVLGLIGIGAASFFRHGSATEFSWGTIVPAPEIKHIIFWSTIAFALTGWEAASFMGEEIRDARRTIPRAILTAAPLCLFLYMMGTMAILVVLPSSEVSGLQGVMQAMASAAEGLGIGGVLPVAAVLVTLSAVGSVSVWLGAAARLPFVAGIDDFLPKSFGRVHPKWGTPHVSLIVQAIIAIVCVVLGQAGTTVRGAYEVLVSLAVIWYLIPFLFLFTAMIRLQWKPVEPGVWRVPGGRPVAILLAVVGLISILIAIVLAFIPSEEGVNILAAAAKILGGTLAMLGTGVVFYVVARRRRTARSGAVFPRGGS